MKTLLIWLCLIVTVSAQTLEEHWTTDFSGGVRPDLSPAMIPDNAAILLENVVIDGTSIKLRPGYTLWSQRLDSLTDGSTPKAVDDAVYGVRGLYEFYNDITDEIQVFAVINDGVWWIADDSTVWHRIGLSAGTATATLNDSIVVGASTDWWPRMLPQNGDDWNLFIADSVEGIHRVIGNKILLDDPWLHTTQSGAKYELTPVFDSTKNLHFTTVNQTCFISDGTRPVVQWSNHTIDNGYYIVDSATVLRIAFSGSFPVTTFVVFSDTLTLDLVDSVQDYGTYLGTSEGGGNPGSHYALAMLDTLEDSLRVHICPIVKTDGDNVLFVLRDKCDSLIGNNGEGLMAYVVRPLNKGYFFDFDTVYSGTIDMTIDGNILVDSSESFVLGEMKSGAYFIDIIMEDSAYKVYVTLPARDPLLTRCYVRQADTNSKTYTGLQVTMPQYNPTTYVLADSAIGWKYVVLKGNYNPRAHFTAWRQGRMWFLASPQYPNTAWYSRQLGWAGLETTNYYDDVSTINYEVIGAADGDQMTGVSIMQQWIIPYKRHHIYAIGGTPPLFDVYLKASNYGLWSDGWLMPYMETNFGLNRLGMFAFNGAAVKDHKMVSPYVSPFFTDSLNLAEMDIVRGELYDDYILFSFPSGSNTSNNKTLVLDTKTGAWSTWSFAAASYLTRRAPGSLDSLLWGATDSASVFIMGGTSDAGTTIEMIYKSPFSDFGDNAAKKQLRKVQITGQFNVNASLSVFVYTDSLHDESYGDTVACSALLGYNTPQDVLFEFPVEIEDATRISIEVRSIGADSLRIDKIGYEYIKTRKVGAQ